jgi:endonuclease YncB( thermonuclease family)
MARERNASSRGRPVGGSAYLFLQCVARAALLSVFVAPGAPAHAQTPRKAEPDCRLTPVGSATVRAVSDDGTLTLDDGRTLRLAGIALWPDRQAADRLAARLAGQTVELKRLGAGTDRYDRLVAHVFVAAAEPWVQADLLEHGLARVARVGDFPCAVKLFAYEGRARAAKLGVWADPYYVMGQAEDPAEVLKGRGRFAIVEGKVLSVRESGGTIYLNFGRRWSEDFTVTIAKRNERAFTGAGLELKKLDGRRVRIRGWIEERGGPWVDAVRPEQIEVLEGAIRP